MILFCSSLNQIRFLKIFFSDDEAGRGISALQAAKLSIARDDQRILIASQAKSDKMNQFNVAERVLQAGGSHLTEDEKSSWFRIMLGFAKTITDPVPEPDNVNRTSTSVVPKRSTPISAEPKSHAHQRTAVIPISYSHQYRNNGSIVSESQKSQQTNSSNNLIQSKHQSTTVAPKNQHKNNGSIVPESQTSQQTNSSNDLIPTNVDDDEGSPAVDEQSILDALAAASRARRTGASKWPSLDDDEEEEREGVEEVKRKKLKKSKIRIKNV